MPGRSSVRQSLSVSSTLSRWLTSTSPTSSTSSTRTAVNSLPASSTLVSHIFWIFVFPLRSLTLIRATDFNKREKDMPWPSNKTLFWNDKVQVPLDD